MTALTQSDATALVAAAVALAAAMERHQTTEIAPVANRARYRDCVCEGFLWYNTEDHSTHVVEIK